MQKRVGELLAERRQAMGASLTDVEGATLIRAFYIEAIERGDYSAIPGEIYLKLYIKSYASFLGMDPQQAAGMLERELSQEPEQKAEEKVIPPSETSMDKRMLQRIKIEQKRRQAARKRTLTTALVIFVLAALILAVYIALGGNWGGTVQVGDAGTAAPQAATEPVQNQVQDVQAVADGPERPAATGNVQAFAHMLTIKFSDDCWIRAYADGRKAFEGIKAAGDLLEISADKGIWVRIGNAGGTSLSYNGEDMGVPGGARKAMDIAFPAGYGPF